MKNPLSPDDIRFLSRVSTSPASDERTTCSCFCFRNRDGSIRWVYPSDLKRPTFLNFFSQSSFRSKFIKFLVTIVFYYKRFVSKYFFSSDFFLDISKDSILDRINRRLPSQNYSIFLGTMGENRKVLVECNDNRYTTSFIKVAVSATSKELVANEYMVLKTLNESGKLNFNFPEILDYEEGVLEITNVKTNKSFQCTKFLAQHFAALKSLYSTELSSANYRVLSHNLGIEENMEALEFVYSSQWKTNDIDLSNFLPKLRFAVGCLQDEFIYSCARGHGDFTPWNVFVEEQSLSIIDWELSRPQVPLFFDMFHFIFQSEVLIKQTEYDSVKKEISLALESPAAAQIQRQHTIDINKHFVSYLVFNISKYLSLYVRQEKPHEQIYWMLSVWECALDDVAAFQGRPL